MLCDRGWWPRRLSRPSVWLASEAAHLVAKRVRAPPHPINLTYIFTSNFSSSSSSSSRAALYSGGELRQPPTLEYRHFTSLYPPPLVLFPPTVVHPLAHHVDKIYDPVFPESPSPPRIHRITLLCHATSSSDPPSCFETPTSSHHWLGRPPYPRRP